MAAAIADHCRDAHAPRHAARRILEIMRTPTDGMLDAAEAAMRRDRRPKETWLSHRRKHRHRYGTMALQILGDDDA